LRIRVRLYGVLKAAAKIQTAELDIDSAASVRQLVGKLVETVRQKEFEAYLIDADLKDPRPNALIIVSGTEIGALDGLDTALKDGDEVVFLPVAHGGEV
jgi:molybdopterin synthase sulfur carrier subunit